MACNVLVIPLRRDHSAVVTAEFQLRQINFCTQLLGTVVHQLAQPSVGGNAACQTHLLCAGVRCGQQQLFGQNARNVVLKAGGKVGQIDFFALIWPCYPSLSTAVFRPENFTLFAVHMGTGRR